MIGHKKNILDRLSKDHHLKQHLKIVEQFQNNVSRCRNLETSYIIIEYILSSKDAQRSGKISVRKR